MTEEVKKKHRIYVAPHVYRHFVPRWSRPASKMFSKNTPATGETGIYAQQILTMIVSSEWGHHYDEVRPKKFEKKSSKGKSEYWILNIMEGKPNNDQVKWCECCQRKHARDTWFQITPDHIIQRSFSNCSSSVKIALPASLSDVLFDRMSQPSLTQDIIRQGKTPEENLISALWKELLKYNRIYNSQEYRKVVNERIANTMDKRNFSRRKFSNISDEQPKENRPKKKQKKHKKAVTEHITFL